MLLIKHTADTKAKPATIWKIWEDVANWNSWDQGIEYATIDGPFQKGVTGTVKPKGGPLVHTELTQVEPMKGFVDESRLFLGRIIFSHSLEDVNGKTAITTQIEMKGPLAFFYALVIGLGMKKNLPREVANMIAKAEKEEGL